MIHHFHQDMITMLWDGEMVKTEVNLCSSATVIQHFHQDGVTRLYDGGMPTTKVLLSVFSVIKEL